MSAPTLRVENLLTHFITRDGVAKAVNEVSFEIGRGEVLGLVGESGSGKSMTGYSLLGMVDAPGKIVGGRVLFTGRDGATTDLRTLREPELRRLRGDRIAMIFQDPMMTLNPVLSIETQMVETLRAHRRITRADARARSRDMLARVGIPAPDERLAAYPHQFSGGMRQRVAIAIALLNEPDLVIADEPTTALDVTLQGQILALMQGLCAETGLSLLWITHDLSVVAGLADRVAVMYAGRLVEQGPVAAVIDDPRHPYTAGLIASAPSRNRRGVPLAQIAGATPSLLKLPSGCSFHPRCARAQDDCRASEPQPTVVDAAAGRREWRCFHPVGEGA